MFKHAWVIAVAGLACSSGSASSTDGGGGPPDEPVVAPDAGVVADGAIADSAIDSGAVDAVAPDAPAAEVSPDATAFDTAPRPDVVTADLDVDMNAFFFGPTVAGCESPMPAVLTVRNAGTVASGTLKVSLEGSSPDRFRIDKDGCTGHALPPAGSCVIEVRFAPRDLVGQPLTAELVVGGVAGESVSTALSGEAMIGHIDVFPWAGNNPVKFPSTAVGTASAPAEAVWTNNTDFPATVGQPGFSGAGTNDFNVASNGCTGQTIAAHQSCRVAIQFKPASTGQSVANFFLAAEGACGYSFTDFLILSGLGE
jgi:hypothetical protein